MMVDSPGWGNELRGDRPDALTTQTINAGAVMPITFYDMAAVSQRDRHSAIGFDARYTIGPREEWRLSMANIDRRLRLPALFDFNHVERCSNSDVVCVDSLGTLSVSTLAGQLGSVAGVVLIGDSLDGVLESLPDNFYLLCRSALSRLLAGSLAVKLSRVESIAIISTKLSYDDIAEAVTGMENVELLPPLEGEWQLTDSGCLGPSSALEELLLVAENAASQSDALIFCYDLSLDRSFAESEQSRSEIESLRQRWHTNDVLLSGVVSAATGAPMLPLLTRAHLRWALDETIELVGETKPWIERRLARLRKHACSFFHPTAIGSAVTVRNVACQVCSSQFVSGATFAANEQQIPTIPVAPEPMSS